MRPLVFNADDFGLSPAVNRSIIRCAHGGLMKSVSLLVTHAAAEDALRLAAGLDEPIGLGLHFCLTSGRAVSPPEKIPLLAAPDGRFRHGFLSLARLLSSSLREEAVRQVRTEFDAADAARRGRFVLRVPTEPVLSAGRLLRSPFLFHAKGFAKKRILDHFLAKSRRGEDFGSSPIYFGIIDSGRMNVSAVEAILGTLARKRAVWENRAMEINLHPWKVAGEENLVPEEASAADRAFAHSRHREEEYELLVKHTPQIQAKLLDLGISASRFNRPG